MNYPLTTEDVSAAKQAAIGLDAAIGALRLAQATLYRSTPMAYVPATANARIIALVGELTEARSLATKEGQSAAQERGPFV